MIKTDETYTCIMNLHNHMISIPSLIIDYLHVLFIGFVLIFALCKQAGLLFSCYSSSNITIIPLNRKYSVA